MVIIQNSGLCRNDGQFYCKGNWLAHGRYWESDFGKDTPVFSDIYQLAQEIETVLYR